MYTYYAYDGSKGSVKKYGDVRIQNAQHMCQGLGPTATTLLHFTIAVCSAGVRAFWTTICLRH